MQHIQNHPSDSRRALIPLDEALYSDQFAALFRDALPLWHDTQNGLRALRSR